jgi:seryl-tRNA synthetase
MTLQEILKAKGMSAEDIESTIGEMKQNKIFTSSEENIDIRYNDLKGKHETLTKQHNENTALIEKYKQEAEQSATLQQTIEQLKAENETLKKQYSDLQEDVAMDRVLLAGGAKRDSLDY